MMLKLTSSFLAGANAALTRLKLSELDSMKALTESTYATHGPDGIVSMVNANPQLRSPMLGHVRGLAGAASMQPQHGMFSGVMHTQQTPLRAAVSGTIAPKIASEMRRKLEKMYGFEPFTLDTHALRKEPRDAPGKGETSATAGPAPVQGSC